MKPITTAKLTTIAKMVARENPDLFKEMCSKSEPLLKNVNLIPAIHSTIKDQNPDLDRTDESILFAACVYHAFAPATLEGSDLERAPNGLRQAMCNVMNWQDAPVVNYYQQMAKTYFKGRSFKERVSAVLLGFERFSVKSAQMELF